MRLESTLVVTATVVLIVLLLLVSAALLAINYTLGVAFTAIAFFNCGTTIFSRRGRHEFILRLHDALRKREEEKQ